MKSERGTIFSFFYHCPEVGDAINILWFWVPVSGHTSEAKEDTGWNKSWPLPGQWFLKKF